MIINLEVDTAKLEARLAELKLSMRTKIVRRSMDRAVTSMQNFAKDLVKDELRLKTGEIKERVQQIKSSDSGLGVFYAGIRIVNAPVPLSKYVNLNSRSRRGVRANIKGQSKAVPGAFIATMRSGHTGVFMRSTSKRLPIDELFSSSVRDVFKDEDVVEKIKEFGREKFEKEFEYNFKYYTSKL